MMLPYFLELGNLRIVLLLLFLDSHPFDIKVLQGLSYHVACSDITSNLLVVARRLRGNHDTLLALS